MKSQHTAYANSFSWAQRLAGPSSSDFKLGHCLSVLGDLHNQRIDSYYIMFIILLIDPKLRTLTQSWGTFAGNYIWGCTPSARGIWKTVVLTRATSGKGVHASAQI